MASVVQPLASTLRVVEWDELPATAREIDPDFDPLDEGVLMLHQRQWLAIHAPIKVAEKGRRTGITFAQALDDTITAASQRVAGGDNIFYIGDTKERAWVHRLLRRLRPCDRDGAGSGHVVDRGIPVR